MTDETEIIITLSDEAWQKWDEGGRLSNHIEVYNEETRQLIIMENNAKLKNLTYQPGVRDVMSLSFNFLMEELTEVVSYDYEAVQESLEGEIVGGETYTVIKDPDRIIFFAEAGGDKHIDKGDSIGLTANEPENDVIQNWYSNNEKIASGESINVEPNTTTEYVLEIIAKDGYKDYDTIVVNVANNYIKNLNPNPASQEISVEYVVDDINNHYICIVNNSGNIVSTHNLSLSQSIITINIQNISSGSYYCQIRNGQQVLSSKPFVKQ